MYVNIFNHLYTQSISKRRLLLTLAGRQTLLFSSLICNYFANLSHFFIGSLASFFFGVFFSPKGSVLLKRRINLENTYSCSVKGELKNVCGSIRNCCQ